MGIIDDLQQGLQQGRAILDSMEEKEFTRMERHFFDRVETGNRLTCGDNLEYMSWLLRSGYAGRFRCIYIDPPFFTKSKFDAVVELRDTDGKKHKIKHLAYDDTFDRNLETYIENMTPRLTLMRELLADDGLIWVHIDWHSAHYIRVLLDEIFGAKNFRNEIIWRYKSGGSSKKHFSRKHDTILVYSKTSKYFLNVPKEKSYNRGLKPYRFRGVKEYRDEFGWYTMVNMKDVWSIDMVGRTSKERTGYATQKPLELLTRIIEASTEPGDLCGDFFCGSGSFPEAAARTGRHWIACDKEELAIATARRRLDELETGFIYEKSERSVERNRVQMERVSAEELQNGKSLYTYRIADFRPDPDYGHMSREDRALCEQILKEDATQFIDYVMIDPDYRGEFNAEVLLRRNFDEIRFLSHGNPAFIIVDLFGKEYFTDGEEV